MTWKSSLNFLLLVECALGQVLPAGRLPWASEAPPHPQHPQEARLGEPCGEQVGGCMGTTRQVADLEK